MQFTFVVVIIQDICLVWLHLPLKFIYRTYIIVPIRDMGWW